MAKVSVTINGVQGEVEQGKTLLEAAAEIGAGVPHLCFGHAICSTCRVNVLDGKASFSPKEIKERVSLDYHMCFDPEVRLACQCKVVGEAPVVVASPKPFRWIAPTNKSKKK